jgi:succinate---hydroxymethylglutarate CoA-transferase
MGTGGARGPLTGVRVMEFGQIAAGPFTGSLLADLGADVVKVERPDGGDGMRNWPPLTGSKMARVSARTSPRSTATSAASAPT